MQPRSSLWGLRPRVRRLLSSLVFTSTVLFSVGCSCEKELPAEDLTQPPAPLVKKEAPSSLNCRVYPAVGATEPRPVALVMARNDELCAETRSALGPQVHFLCTQVDPPQVEKTMKEALRYLKKSYPRHVSSQPVLLFTSKQYSTIGWHLMLGEPGFFAFAYLSGLKGTVLTSTTLAKLNRGGARALAVTEEPSERLAFLAGVAARRGLSLQPVGVGPEGLARALAIFRDLDPRLQSAD